MAEVPELSKEVQDKVDEVNAHPDTLNVIDDSMLMVWHESFVIFDKDGNGFIEHKELATVLRAMGQNPTEADVKEMIDVADVTNDNQIEWKEFVLLMIKTGKYEDRTEKELIDAFKVFDKNGDGKIDAKELREVMKTMGECQMTDDEVDEMIKEADIDGDGFINIKEFTKIMNDK